MQVGNDGGTKAELYARLTDAGAAEGSFERLGAGYSALLLDGGPMLLVTFETASSIQGARLDQLPLATTLVDEAGFSQLTIITEADTWYRDPVIYAYFDGLTDDGFFDNYDRVVFYGTGMCGYAAAAFSVAAPGATVIAISPQATLDPRVTEWDRRYLTRRRLSFTDRYGYAPDMLEAADHAYILYDPKIRLDAIHAALFTRPNVSKLRCRMLGRGIEPDLLNMGVLTELIDAACEGHLNEMVFHRLFRARRDYPPYIRELMEHLEQTKRPYLTALLCHNAAERISRPRFRNRLSELENELASKGRSLPWVDKDKPQTEDP